MNPHPQHVQLLHHHVNVSVQNLRKPLLDCGKTKLGRKCIAIVIPLAVIAAVLSIGFKFISGPGDLGHETSGTDYLSPYTSRVFPISGLYCDSYRMTKYSGSTAVTLLWNTSLYILNDLPALSSLYNFSIHTEDQSMIILKPGEFYQWSFILHAGSRYEINSCVLRETDEALVLVIKGKALFNEWVDKKQCSGCTKYDLPSCNSTTEQNVVDKNIISKDDEYYFVYINPTRKLSHVQPGMSFTKLEYSLDEDDIYCHCDYIQVYPEYYACSSCDLPLTFNGYILLRTVPQTSDYVGIDWEDKIYVTWSCDASYSYAYLLLFCLPFMVIVVTVLVCSDIIVPCMSRCRRRSSTVTATEQSPSIQRSRKVLIAALWFLLVLLMSLVSVCIVLAGFTLILSAISFISKAPGIQGIFNSKLKLCLLALTTVLFVVSLLCNKLKQWIQTKLHSIATIIHQQRQSQIAQNHQAGNTSDINFSSIRADIVKHLQNQVVRVMFVCGVVPLVIMSSVAISAMFTFLEAFFPVLSTYSWETDSAIFIPGDTQTFSFNSFFCSEYSISSYGSPHLSATLEIVNSDSVVTNYSDTYISSNDSVSAEFLATWNFYLNEKSDASIKACLLEDDPMESIVSFDLYQYDSDTTNHLNPDPHINVITDDCYGDLWRVPIGNISGNGGKYLVVLSTNYTYPIKTHVEIELINRFLYYAPHDVIMNSSAQTCSVSSHTSDTCTAAAPFSTGSMTGIISVHSDQSAINWHETLSITKTCQYHIENWIILWLPVLLINVVIFSVFFGTIQVMIYKQIRKKFNQKEATETDDHDQSEPLLHREANDNSYGSNATRVATDTPDTAGSPTANPVQSLQQSDPEPHVHGVVGLEVQDTSDHSATAGTSDPQGVAVQIEHPPSTGDRGMESTPTFESGSAVLLTTASIESISDSRDGTENIEHSTADIKPIVEVQGEHVIARP